MKRSLKKFPVSAFKTAKHFIFPVQKEYRFMNTRNLLCPKIAKQIKNFCEEAIETFFTYLPTYLPTPWRSILLKKLTGSQLVKKFPAFYGTRRFITAFTSARQLFLF